MAANPSKELLAWLTRLCADITEDGAYSRYELLHNVEGEAGECIDTWPSSLDAPRIADELAREIWESASQDADSRVTSLPERYSVRAYRRSTEVQEAQFSFLIQSRRAIDRYGATSEPATEKGALAYGMRHAENAFRILTASSEAIFSRMKNEIERETARRTEAEEARLKMMVECQSLLDRAQERRIEEAKEILKQKRLDEVLSTLMPLIPIVVERLVTSFGGAAASNAEGARERNQPHQTLQRQAAHEPQQMTIGQPRDPVVDELVRFMNQLSESEMSSIQAGLDPKKALVFGQILEAIAEGNISPTTVKTAVQKFLKSLSESETFGIFSALSGANREKLMKLYAHFRALEEAEQADRPDVIRS